MNVAEKEAIAAAAKFGAVLIACLLLIVVIIFGSADALKLIVYHSRSTL